MQKKTENQDYIERLALSIHTGRISYDSFSESFLYAANRSLKRKVDEILERLKNQSNFLKNNEINL